jgi:hypothetical protein
MKRLNYERVRISTIGGIVDCTPSSDGWRAAFEPHAEQPRVGYGKSIEEAAQKLVNELKAVISAVEEDLKAFAERNK